LESIRVKLVQIESVNAKMQTTFINYMYMYIYVSKIYFKLEIFKMVKNKKKTI